MTPACSRLTFLDDGAERLAHVVPIGLRLPDVPARCFKLACESGGCAALHDDLRAMLCAKGVRGVEGGEKADVPVGGAGGMEGELPRHLLE